VRTPAPQKGNRRDLRGSVADGAGLVEHAGGHQVRRRYAAIQVFIVVDRLLEDPRDERLVLARDRGIGTVFPARCRLGRRYQAKVLRYMHNSIEGSMELSANQQCQSTRPLPSASPHQIVGCFRYATRNPQPATCSLHSLQVPITRCLIR
jgi:hypothetical protein